VAVLVNKIDLVGYDPAVFRALEAELNGFLGEHGVTVEACIPVSGREGDNLASRSSATTWYCGKTLVEYLDGLEEPLQPTELPFRMPVQGIYKFTAMGDERRIVAGGVASGRLRPGDVVTFYPSGKHSRVRSLEAFNSADVAETRAGSAAGFTLTDQIYVSRGEVACRADEARPAVAARLRVSLFWLGTAPLVRGHRYRLKLGTAAVGMELESVERLVDAAELGAREAATQVARHEVAECVLRLDRAVAVDPAGSVAATGRFVIVDEWEIAGGGIVREALADPQAAVREGVLVRNAKWEPSAIPIERRIERFGHQPAMLLITGPRDADRKALARAIETRLFDEGRLAYFLGIGNVLYGVDADLDHSRRQRHEHLRRLGEVANLMLEAGMLLVVTAADLTAEEIDLLRTTVDAARIHTVWLDGGSLPDFAPDLALSKDADENEQVSLVRTLLEDHGAVPRS
jgi:bifunctional enzyme CysN/CysC